MSAAPGYLDAHVHLWDTRRLRYQWLDDEPVLGLPHLLVDYRAATADHPPDGFVFVQAGADDADGAAEARWVHDTCAGEPDFAGMVVWAPAEAGAAAVGRHLDGLAFDTVVGVRRLVQAEPPGFCRGPRFVEAVREVGRRGLAFDVCILPAQIDDALVLAAAASDTRLVLDHCAKPDIAGGGLPRWRDDAARLAAHDNVWCKLSGLVTEADHDDWTVDDLAPYVDVALEAFGADRLLWGSDWPVVNLAASHQRWRQATGDLLTPLGNHERAAVMAGTARAVYDLG